MAMQAATANKPKQDSALEQRVEELTVAQTARLKHVGNAVEDFLDKVG